MQKDITGQRFGRLIVVKKVRPYEVDYKFTNRETHYLCKCDCDGQIIIQGSALRHGRTKSCGCIRRENAAEVGRQRGRQYGKNGI